MRLMALRDERHVGAITMRKDAAMVTLRPMTESEYDIVIDEAQRGKGYGEATMARWKKPCVL